MKSSITFFGLLAALIVTITSCGTEGGNASSHDGLTISGDFENAAGREVYFQIYDGLQPADTAVVGDDGSFTFNLDRQPLEFYKLFVDKNSQMVLILDSTDHHLEVSADASNIPGTMAVSGSKDSELMVDFFRRQNAFNMRIDSLNKVMQTMTPDMGQIRMAMGKQIANEKMDFEKEMAALAEANSSSPATLGLVAMINPANHIATLEKVEKDLKKRMPGSKYTDSLTKQLARAKQAKTTTATAGAVAIGQMAPDLDLNDPDGKSIPLSSLRGKYVLIDFWASWCGPCRRENPNVKAMYDKYKKENFEIYGVSFDSTKDRWVKAIEQDGLPWIHVSDLKKWQSIAAGIYGVRSIPHTVLLDPEGKVVATKLRGAQLDAKMAEIFGY